MNAITGTSGRSKINGKFESLKYHSLGGAIVANYTMGGETDLVNPTQYKYGAYSLWDQDAKSQSSGYVQGQSGGRYYTFQLISSLFGGHAEKYLPMSAINGMRIILSLDNDCTEVVLQILQTLFPKPFCLCSHIDLLYCFFAQQNCILIN